jgi:SRSO17 transposase
VHDRRAVYQLRRLMTWLEAFKECFGHRAHVLALRRYVQGLLSDSPRKSMEAMLARVTEPGSYQAFQHFITDAPWNADAVWRRLRAVIPEREGLLIFDGTSFPKQGRQSVGVARQYCGALGKIANCQVAVTAALWTGVRAYLLGAALYLPEEWLTDPAGTQARIPRTIRFHTKWRQAVTLLRQVRASGFRVTGVVADAECGDNRLFRALLHRLHLPYAMGISSSHTVFLGTPALQRPQPGRRGRPRKHPQLAPSARTHSLEEAIVAAGGRWRRIRWRNRPVARQWTADGLAIRVTPAVDCHHPRLAPEIWLLAERDVVRLLAPRSTSSTCRRAPPLDGSSDWRINAGRSSSNTKTSRRNSVSIISKGGHLPAGTTTSCSRRLPPTSCKPSDTAPEPARPFRRSAASCRRSSLRICLHSDRSTSHASRHCGPFSSGSDKVVLEAIS